MANKFQKKISQEEWQDRTYELCKELVSSFAINRDYEDFKHLSRKERVCFVSIGIAETLLSELGYKADSSITNEKDTKKVSENPPPKNLTSEDIDTGSVVRTLSLEDFEKLKKTGND